jgi:hypothetical protein
MALQSKTYTKSTGLSFESIIKSMEDGFTTESISLGKILMNLEDDRLCILYNKNSRSSFDSISFDINLSDQSGTLVLTGDGTFFTTLESNLDTAFGV